MLTTARRQRLPKPTRKRALELLVDCPRREGCTEAVLLAHGFTIEQMVELVHEGLATATAEGEVDTLWITEKGRRTLERLRS